MDCVSRACRPCRTGAMARAAAGRLQPHLFGASARRHGAEKPTVSGRIGRQGVPACSRSQENEAVKGGARGSRTLLDAREHLGLACAAMPLPHTRRARVHRAGAGAGSAPAAPHRPPPSRCGAPQHGWFRRRRRSPAADARRCPRPAPRWPASLAGVVARQAAEALFSSMAAPFQGWWRSRQAAGGRQEFVCAADRALERASSRPELERAARAGRQAAPRSRTSQTRGRWPSGCCPSWPGRRRRGRAGSGWRRSPKGTTPSSKRSVICRAPAPPAARRHGRHAEARRRASSIPSNPTTARPVRAHRLPDPWRVPGWRHRED